MMRQGTGSTAGSSAEARRFLAERAEIHVGWRRHLHQWPEIGFEEHRTAAFVADRLTEMGMAVDTGIAGTGVVATLEGREDGPTAGLRADMDALPILEETGLPYQSGNRGASHACGHDGHMAMLLAAADYLAASRDFAGRIRFIFQPAEEARGGGRAMVEAGLFERWPVEAVFGLHNWPGLPLGTVAAKPGPVMAAMDLFKVTLKASGVHAALPHLGTDAIVAAGALIGSLQTIVSRTIDTMQPTVVSLTQIHGGHSLNALPDEVVLNGTVRSLSQESRERARESIGRIVEGVARTHDVEAAFDIEPMYPVTVNDPEWARVAADIAARTWGAEAVTTDYLPSMASEDFAFMLDVKPGCYAWIGNGRSVPLHNPAFDFNDDLIPIGALYWAELAKNWAERGEAA
jgi:hippurate hydrolase